MRLLLAGLLLFGCRSTPETPFGDEALYDDVSESVELIELTADGGRVDWGWAEGRIAFDRLGDDGFFDVWTMDVDGGDARCLTCDMPGLPTRNVGQPAWHPSGEWLVVQVEKAESDARAFAAHPGRGSRNDLWLVRADGAGAFPLTNVENGPGNGVLHAHFHGDVLTWSHMLGGISLDTQGVLGRWELRMATVSFDPEPHLVDLRATDLGHDGFFENHGLSADGSRWVFSANLDPDKGYAALNDIYTIDVDTLGDLARLTTHGYNEHAAYVPGSSDIVWMSNAGNRDRGTDWWRASPDGSGLTRLTRLRGSSSNGRAIAADLSFGPEGDAFVGYVQGGVGASVGRIVMVRLAE